jgi:hypothetical protein
MPREKAGSSTPHPNNPPIPKQEIYMSPYLPNFSAIETCWSNIKRILRTIEAKTYPALDEVSQQTSFLSKYYLLIYLLLLPYFIYLITIK